MKPLFLYLLLCPAVLFAQQITFKAEGGQGKPIRIMQPINGKFVMAAWKQDTLNANGEITIPNNSRVPGAYEFFYKKEYRLYVHPGQSYTINTNNEIQAPDADGQKALNNLTFEFYQTVAMRYYKADTVFTRNKAKVLAEMSARLAPFQTLFEQKKIDKVFHQYAEKLIKTYYANLLACTFIEPMMKLEYNRDSARYDAEKLKTIRSHWQDVLAVADPHDNASMNVSTYFDYSNFYTAWYLAYFLPGEKGTYERPTKADDYWTKKYTAIQSGYKEPLREYLVANWIFSLTMEDGFEPFVMDWYRDFTKRYPKSNYTSKLTPGVDKVRAYHNKIKSNFATDQQFVEGYAAIDNFQQLADRFKDKTMYVDLWATWCGPCKAEFKYNESLKKFLKTKGMQVLYISLDNESADKKWKDMIRYYDLQGYHVRASAKLMDDIRKIFGTKRSLSIPRYAIIKNGKMVLDNAKPPSDKEELYKQISELL